MRVIVMADISMLRTLNVPILTAGTHRSSRMHIRVLLNAYASRHRGRHSITAVPGTCTVVLGVRDYSKLPPIRIFTRYSSSTVNT